MDTLINLALETAVTAGVVVMWFWPIALIYYAGHHHRERPWLHKITTFSSSSKWVYIEKFGERSHRNAKIVAGVWVITWFIAAGAFRNWTENLHF